ncbi:D-2-hydroxyacid dehydrogenase [Caballeronia sp. LZ035]|uniref:D-2-hydroxyacid dehydrogenase n=1 Tax=Caballeronia sp. LZ035 TaxID=3038568 RepID=UPI002866418C|nr:D-2-hydroxyacid dehydrogenase [Caballeronia sp. LZ035]MDR5760444.1 D-2-hydroxyacid dehydrogenase [Caballeronia sp. LZ035]
MNIVFLDRATLAPQTRLRRPDFAHVWREYPATAAHEVAERIRDADIVITNKAPISAAALDHAPRVKLVAVAATGTNVIDLEACKARGIAVSNIRDYARHTVPEHTFALIFALRRSLIAYRESVRAGRWEESGQFCFFDHPIRDLAGSTLGVIGDGALGRAVAALGQALGMRVLMAAHKGREGMGSLYTPFDTVLRTSDVITLHCPLTPATRNLIDTPEFTAMERRPLLINTARGGLVNEHALGPALREGRIAGAGFDVATSEPLAAEHPFRALLDLPNFILTPHVAWASEEAVQALADQLTDNLEAFARGAPRNLVIV